jgi:hypothetical protein
MKLSTTTRLLEGEVVYHHSTFWPTAQRFFFQPHKERKAHEPITKIEAASVQPLSYLSCVYIEPHRIFGLHYLGVKSRRRSKTTLGLSMTHVARFRCVFWDSPRAAFSSWPSRTYWACSGYGAATISGGNHYGSSTGHVVGASDCGMRVGICIAGIQDNRTMQPESAKFKFSYFKIIRCHKPPY